MCSAPSAFLHSHVLYPPSLMLRHEWCITVPLHLIFWPNSIILCKQSAPQCQEELYETRHSWWTLLSVAMLPIRFLQAPCWHTSHQLTHGGLPEHLQKTTRTRNHWEWLMDRMLPKGKHQLPGLSVVPCFFLPSFEYSATLTESCYSQRRGLGFCVKRNVKPWKGCLFLQLLRNT